MMFPQHNLGHQSVSHRFLTHDLLAMLLSYSHDPLRYCNQFVMIVMILVTSLLILYPQLVPSPLFYEYECTSALPFLFWGSVFPLCFQSLTYQIRTNLISPFPMSSSKFQSPIANGNVLPSTYFDITDYWLHRPRSWDISYLFFLFF